MNSTANRGSHARDPIPIDTAPISMLPLSATSSTEGALRVTLYYLAMRRQLMTRIPELDGLRGLAILLVLMVHFSADRLPAPFAAITQFGWAGVDLFFVLSGFLITGILLDSREEEQYYRVFWTNRVLRIFPLYYGFLFVYWIARGFPGVYLIYGGNFLSATGHAIPAMNHFWSLAIEEQFYFAWPFVVRDVPVNRLMRLCVAVIGMTVIARLCIVHYRLPAPEFVYALTPLRWDALLMGALVACMRYSGALVRFAHMVKWTALAGASSLAMGILIAHGTWYTSPGIERFGYFGADLLFSSLIASVALWGGSPWFGVTRSRFLVFFGTYSYAIYMFHFPISRWVAGSLPGSPVAQSVAGTLVGTGLSVAAALVSRPAEQWFLRRKLHFPRPLIETRPETLPATPRQWPVDGAA
jgi:peptidoglycan/LPS O-acetylase OafA/YrhL